MKKNILIMVANVGSTSFEQNSLKDEAFIYKEKYAMKLLIEKKIFLQQKDEIGIITMGEATSNVDMENIKLYSEHLLVPNWEMVKYINHLTSTNYPCNWIESLFVSLNFIKKEAVNPEFRVFLVIFNNFKENDEDINQYDSDIIVKELKNYNNIHLLFVGKKQIHEMSLSDNSITDSEKFLLTIIEKTSAQYEQINIFIENRKFYISPPVNSFSWKFNLEWGGLKIPCTTNVKITETVKLGSWKMQTINNSQDKLDNLVDPFTIDSLSQFQKVLSVVKENVTIDIHRNEVNSEIIINGYKFGGKYIPFSGEDGETMKYTESRKGMLVYGFIPQNDIKLEYWSGCGSRIIVPLTNEYAEAFYSFVKAMVNNQYAAIVRKVYADNNLPKMGILFPKMYNEDIWCLVHVEIPFIHDLRNIKKGPIKSLEKIIDKKKFETLENFINSMMVSENELAYLNLGMFPNICSQYHWNAFANRAINLEGSLIPLNNYLNKYLFPPEYLCIKAKPYIEKLNKLFESCTINNDFDKKQKKVSVLKGNDNANNIANEHNEHASKKHNNTDKEFFYPEDVNLCMKELEDM